MKYYIYRLINTADNCKSYIGLTKNPKKRFNKCQYKGQRIKAAIEKFGWNSFTHEILADASTIREANSLERSYIKAYKTLDPEFGYNIQRGGSFSRRGYKRSVAALKKQSATMHKTSWFCNPETNETIRLLPEAQVPEGFVPGRGLWRSMAKGYSISKEGRKNMIIGQRLRRARERALKTSI